MPEPYIVDLAVKVILLLMTINIIISAVVPTTPIINSHPLQTIEIVLVIVPFTPTMSISVTASMINFIRENLMMKFDNQLSNNHRELFLLTRVAIKLCIMNPQLNSLRNNALQYNFWKTQTTQ